MNQFFSLSLAMIFVLTASLCYGDKLVITYRSGETQSIQLDKPSQEVSSWQYIAEPSVTINPVQKNSAEAAPPQPGAPPTAKPSEPKSSLRYKLNAKPIPD